MGEREKRAYAEYLQSDTWQVLRKQRLELDRGRCVLCDKKAKHVHHRKYPKVWGTETITDLCSLCEKCHKNKMTQVHHKNYRRLGREKLSDLLGLCEKCHQKEHGIEKVYLGSKGGLERIKQILEEMKPKGGLK